MEWYWVITCRPLLYMVFGSRMPDSEARFLIKPLQASTFSLHLKALRCEPRGRANDTVRVLRGARESGDQNPSSAFKMLRDDA